MIAKQFAVYHIKVNRKVAQQARVYGEGTTMKSIMKKLCFQISLMFLLGPLGILTVPTTWAAQKVEIYTYGSLPPFAYRDDQNNLTGVYIEIVKAIDKKIPEYDIDFKVVPWPRAKHLAENGKAFAILPPYFHAHDWLTKAKPQRPYLWPYSQTIYTQTDVVICNNKVSVAKSASFPQEFTNLSFASMRGDGRAGQEFANLVKSKSIRLSELDSTPEAILFMLRGRADCVVASRASFYWYLNKLKEVSSYDKNTQDIAVQFEGTEVKLKEVKVIAENYGHLGYTDINAEQNFPFKKDFSIRFDIELYKMKKSGEIERIVADVLVGK